MDEVDSQEIGDRINLNGHGWSRFSRNRG